METISSRSGALTALGLVGLLAMALGWLAGAAPALTVVTLAGLVYAATAFANPVLSLSLFVVMTFLNTLPGLGSASVSAAKLAGFVLVAAWAGRITTGRVERSFVAEFPGLTYLLIAFLAWVAISATWATSSGEAIVTTSRYALNFALLPLVFSVVRTHRDLVQVAGAYVVGAALSAICGIGFGLNTVADEGVTRATGTFGDPNDFGAALLVGLVIAFGLAGILPRRSIGRFLTIGGAALCAAGMLLSVSRGPVIALGVVFLVSTLLGGRWRRRAIIVAVLGIVLTVGYFAAIAPEASRARIASSDGGTGRSDVWKVGWRMVEAHPLLGVGVGNFQVVSAQYVVAPGAIQRDDLVIDSPRVGGNTYLSVIAELGAIGLAMFVLLIGWLARLCLVAARAFERRRDLRMGLLTRTVLIALLGLLASYVFISGQLYKQLWILLALIPVLNSLARHGDQPG